MTQLIKNSSTLFPALLFAFLLPLGGISGYADSFDFPGLRLAHDSSKNQISEQGAVARVQVMTGGKVLAVRRIDSGYLVKVLTLQGSVRIIHVDVRTGAMTPSY